MRATWKAGPHRGATIDESVALKMLFVSKSIPEYVLKDFHVEAIAMAQLEHPNITRLLGACIRPPHLSLVQELAPYGSLNKLLQRVPFAGLPWGVRWALAADCCRGVE